MAAHDAVLLYALVGLGCGAAVLSRSRGRRWPDALLLVPFWPVLGPFTLSRPEQPATSAVPVAAAFLAAVEQARTTALAPLLPTAEEARALVQRLEAAAERLAEADRLLALPEFDAEQARSRHQELVARGESRAATAAQTRAAHLGRLGHLRDRWAGELEAVHELVAQLRIQTEVVRLAGDGGEEPAALIGQVIDLVQGFDAALEDDPVFLAPSPAETGT